MYRTLIVLFLVSILTINCFAETTVTNHWESIFNADAQFNYWSSNKGELNNTWRTINFNDASWLKGKGGIGYGDNDDGTTIDICNSVAIRHSFNVNNKADLTEAWIYIDYDDAYIAYLNGTEIARSEGITEAYPALSQLSSTQHEAGTRIGINIPSTQLNEILLNGKNVFALQVHNATATSSDLSSSAWLITGVSTSALTYQAAPDWFDVPFSFTSSNLPIILIETTDHKTISDEPKIEAQMKIINNASGINQISDFPNEYDGLIGIELRGNSTQGFPKKPYNLETRQIEVDIDNSKDEVRNFNVPLFGWPKENDWVLRASYLDHTFIRNGLADYLSRLNGWWAARTQLVEVVLNGDYQGIYVFMEDIKPDKGRCDIATLNPDEITEPDITGGYIWEITGFETNLGDSRKLKYPAFDEAAPEQIAYIKNYDDQFRSLMHSNQWDDSLHGYANWIDVESFVNEILVQEAMRNSDAYGWSGYFHKNKNGKINAGPVWDFDQSAGNSSYPDNGVVEGWMFEHPNTNNTPFFWPLLFKDPVFSYAVRYRWETLRKKEFSNEHLFSYIDSIASLLGEAQTREFSKWDVLGKNIWRETSNYQLRNTYQKEVDYLKDFLSQRWAWMDNELAKYENPYPNTQSTNHTLAYNSVIVYPNPAQNRLSIKLNNIGTKFMAVTIYNSMGAVLQTEDLFNRIENEKLATIHLNEDYRPGLYFYKIIIDDEQEFVGRFIKVE